MPLFDTHCHYNLDPLWSEEGGWRAHWKRAQESGVTHSLVVGTSVETSARAISIASESSNLFAAVGIHPSECIEQKTIDVDMEHIQKMITKDLAQTNTHHIRAIGETGLDYYWLPTGDPTLAESLKSAQKYSVRQHIALAQSSQLPLILHVRDREEAAYWDMLRLLTDADYTGQFVLHCVSGPLEYIREALERGAYISVAANVTYPSAGHIRDIVAQVPHDRLLLETDAPFLPPKAHRGSPCMPWMISETAHFLTKELAVNTDDCYAQSHRLFRTPPSGVL